MESYLLLLTLVLIMCRYIGCGYNTCRPDVASVLESSVESLASYLILVNGLIVSLFCTFMQISEACQAVNVSSLKTNACRTDVNWRYRTSKLSQ
jgi:hypothetical protein